MKSKHTYTIIILVIVAGGIFYFIKNKPVEIDQPTNTEVKTTEIAPGVSIETTEKGIDKNSTIVAPNLNKKMVFPASYNENAQKIMLAKINPTISFLKQNGASYDSWIDLAIYRKMLNDYVGAEEIWVYLTKVAPSKPDAYLNLGDLYAYYLHDNTKAEKYFLIVQDVSPKWVVGYERTVDFYVTVLQDKTKAKNFLDNSIIKYPDMKTGLQPLLDSLKN